MEEEVNDIVEMANDADREEDILGDRYNFRYEEYKDQSYYEEPTDQLKSVGLFVVAGAGFEPTTSGL